MPALYTITTRASGTILTAAIYNTDHQNHVNNGDAQHLGGFSANTSQMRTQTSPGDVGTESLALSISDELARIRYMIALMRGTTFWYGTAVSYPGSSVNNYVRNSNFLVAQRMGQAPINYGVTIAGLFPYTLDQWYLACSANQSMYVTPNNTLYSNDLGGFGITRLSGSTGIAQTWTGQPFTLAQLAPLRGKQVTASISFTTGANWSPTNLTMSIVCGTGTACKVAAGFTGPTSPLTVSVPTTPSMALSRISCTGVIPVNTSQMEFFLGWSPVGTAGASDAISFAQAKLELGAQMTPYIPPDPYVELQELSAFYWKSFQLGIVPAQNTGGSGPLFQLQGSAASTATQMFLRWPTRMIKAPTVMLYNPLAVNAQVRNFTTSTDCTASAAASIDESACIINCTPPAGSASANTLGVHVAADAGL